MDDREKETVRHGAAMLAIGFVSGRVSAGHIMEAFHSTEFAEFYAEKYMNSDYPNIPIVSKVYDNFCELEGINRG